MAHAEEGKEDWVAIQKKTFTKWLNNHLRKKGYKPMGDVQNEFEDGVKLCEVVNALYDLPLPKLNRNARMRPHKLDNLSLALKMVEVDAKIKTNFLKSTHLIDHDLKMILGMIWAIILDFAIKGISVDELTAKEGLLLWCRKKTAGYAHVDPPGIQGFTRDWKNGLAFCALIHRHQPQMLDYASLDPKNAKENLELAFSSAEKLGIPRLLDVEDLQHEKPDERSVMTYIAEYFHRFATQDQKELAARRAQKFVKFARGMAARKHEYEQRARALLAWAESWIEELAKDNLGNSLEESVQTNNDLRHFLVQDKPPKSGEKLDIEGLFAEINTELKVNNRAPYVPPAELTPEAIDAAWDRLQVSEKVRAKAARENRFRFIKKEEAKIPEEKQKEFEASFKHFDANGDNSLSPIEFKAAATAVSLVFKDEAALQKVFGEVSEGKGGISLVQYMHFLNDLHQDRDSPDQIRASFRELAGDADTISADQLRVPPLAEDEVAYLAQTIPKAADGRLDYNKYIQENFV
jgi:Ca2+-binding EF-hand superfamily protein